MFWATDRLYTGLSDLVLSSRTHTEGFQSLAMFASCSAVAQNAAVVCHSRVGRLDGWRLITSWTLWFGSSKICTSDVQSVCSVLQIHAVKVIFRQLTVFIAFSLTLAPPAKQYSLRII